MRRINFNAALIAAMAALLMLTACGRGNKEAESTPPPVLRTPIPTFTPTVPSLTESSNGSSSAETGSPANAAAAQSDAPSAEALNANPANVAASAPSASAGATEAGARGVGGPLEPPSVVVPIQPALGTINTELVNSRSGPDTTHSVVMILGKGEYFDITGKSADGGWVRVCCISQQEAWVKLEFLDVNGSLDALPVAQAGETSGQTVTRSAASAQATVAAAPAPAAQSETQPVAEPVAEVPAASTAGGAEVPAEVLPASAESLSAADVGGYTVALAGQEQFPETNVVRVFLFVYKGTEALEGYTLRVVKDGVEQSASAASFGGRPGMTWPIADDRQRFQNLKLEFPGVAAAGTWEVTLMKDGVPVGDTATFALAEGDPNQELYVRYAEQ